MIVFSVWVSRYGSGKAVSGIHARGFFRRSSSMMVWRSYFVQRPLRSSTSTIAAISHMLEIVAKYHHAGSCPIGKASSDSRPLHVDAFPQPRSLSVSGQFSLE